MAFAQQASVQTFLQRFIQITFKIKNIWNVMSLKLLKYGMKKFIKTSQITSNRKIS